MENFGNENFRGDSHKWLAIAYIIIALILAGMILSWILFLKKGTNNFIQIRICEQQSVPLLFFNFFCEFAFIFQSV